MSRFASERSVGIQAVIKASRLCQMVSNTLVKDSILKSDSSPVTIADYGAQAVINKIIHTSFPLIGIVGEEDSKELIENKTLLSQVLDLSNLALGQELTFEELIAAIDLGKCEGGDGTFWTLDPIDGTKGFLRGGQYAVCLSLIEKGVVQVAVQGCPNLLNDLNDSNSKRGSLFVAVRGQGVFQRSFDDEKETRVHVCDVDIASETSFCESVEAAHSSQAHSRLIADLLKIKKQSIRMDSQCKYALIARGDAGIYLRVPANKEYIEKIWDHAGGSLLVEEAGGKICDINGQKLDFTRGRTLNANKGIVATNGLIHNEVLRAIRKVFP